MDVEIKQKKENALFERQEVLAYVTFNGSTPKRAEIKADVANKIAANPDSCILRNVKSEFGMCRLKVLLHVYESQEKAKKYEPLYILVREGFAQKPEKKKKEKKAAEPKKK